MQKQICWFVTIAVALIAFTPVSVAQSETKYEELPNFHQVNKNLYRGAQPKHGGIQKLAQLGIKTIINLRADDNHAHAEETEARASGLRYFNVAMDNFGRPSDNRIQRVLAIINAPENQPVFVHCKRGADRTGTVIAVYRIEHDGWTSESAKAEADHYGMALWQIGMKHYIHDYFKRRAPRTGNVEMPGAPFTNAVQLNFSLGLRHPVETCNFEC
jgi:tyrosine-protein phosphatase SIW14